MSRGQRFSGQTARQYDEFPEHARRLLFSKDREARKLTARYAKAESTLEFIHWVIRDEGRRDPAWVLERITESLLGHGYWPKCEEHLAPEPCAECHADDVEVVHVLAPGEKCTHRQLSYGNGRLWWW